MVIVGKEEFKSYIESHNLEETVCNQCPVSCRLFKEDEKLKAAIVLYEELKEEHKLFKDNVYKILER